MKIFILLFGYLISLKVTMLEAMLGRALNRGLELIGARSHLDVRRGDFVSVSLRGRQPYVTRGVYTGYLEGPVENPEALPGGSTNNRLFVRLSHGVFYAYLVHHPSVKDDLYLIDRCYIEGAEDKNGRDEIFFSADLSPKKPSESSNVWIENHTVNHLNTPYMWGVNLEQCIHMSIPIWAYKKNFERQVRIESSQH